MNNTAEERIKKENILAQAEMLRLGYITVRVDRYYIGASFPYYLGQVIECDSKAINVNDWIWFPINAGGGDKECPIRIIHENDIYQTPLMVNSDSEPVFMIQNMEKH